MHFFGSSKPTMATWLLFFTVTMVLRLMVFKVTEDIVRAEWE